jgi:hypothetical protein
MSELGSYRDFLSLLRYLRGNVAYVIEPHDMLARRAKVARVEKLVRPLQTFA